jgi:hypothetical protein
MARRDAYGRHLTSEVRYLPGKALGMDAMNPVRKVSGDDDWFKVATAPAGQAENGEPAMR